MIIVLGSIVTRPDTFEQALALSQAHVHRSRAEPGCIAHAVHRDTENPLRLVFVEEWADPAALQQHFRLPASREFVKVVTALAAEAPRMAVYEASPAAAQ